MTLRRAVLLLGAALALLLAAICLPWVSFDPPAERADRLQHLETLAGDPALPAFIHEELIARGIRPGLSPEQLWSLLGQDDYTDNFDFVRDHERLFSWDLLRLQTAGWLKLAVLSVYLAAAAGATLLAAHAAGAHLAAGPLSVAIAVTCTAALLLVLAATPLLDTFGFTGEWGPGWLDAVSGARATVVPRALLPLALIVLLVGAPVYQAYSDAEALLRE